jgi:AcrR family transcriptional regulator
VTTNQDVADSRPRGRPRLTIDRDAIAEAVADLLGAGGYEAVGVPEVAEKLEISRATLYRTVPTKSDLIGILFENRTRELSKQARAAIAATPTDSAQQLTVLITLQANAAVHMRRYMPVFFGGGDLPSEVFERWHAWSKQYENMWVKVVSANMRDGHMDNGDARVTARLILGMLIWVSRWYRPVEKVTADEIADAALRLLGMQKLPIEPAAPQPGARKSPAKAPAKRVRQSPVKKAASKEASS